MRRIKPRTIIFALLTTVLVGCVEKTTTISLQRVAVLGASVTAGWGITTPPIPGDFGAYPVTMKHIMEGMIEAPHEEVGYFGDTMFFIEPNDVGKELIEQVLEHEPTLVIAVDFLFWFAYGLTGADDDVPAVRLESFELGLALLDKLEAHVIVGDIPDMHASIGKILSARRVPTPLTINRMNARLREWAMKRPRVSVINVHDIVEDLMRDVEISVANYTWLAGSRSKLLQQDMLHPTLEGTVAISLLMVDFIGENGLQTDPKLVMKEAVAAAREN